MTTPPTIRHRFLSEPSTVGHARDFVADFLRDAGAHDEMIEMVTLLVSETVTNAVLYAGTEIDVACNMVGDRARVEVTDQSPIMPGMRNYGLEAPTGRGLSIVAMIATAWGATSDIDGKTVWFEVAALAATGAHTEPVVESSPPSDHDIVVHLRNAPADLLRATLRYGDALLRELALVTVHRSSIGRDRWEAPDFDITALLAPLDHAERVGVAHVDLQVPLTLAGAAAAVDRMTLVDEAERLAAANHLLSTPCPPDICRCRTWLYTEITRQAGGALPIPWDPDPDASATRR